MSQRLSYLGTDRSRRRGALPYIVEARIEKRISKFMVAVVIKCAAGFFFVCYMMLTNIAVINVIVAVIVENTVSQSIKDTWVFVYISRHKQLHNAGKWGNSNKLIQA